MDRTQLGLGVFPDDNAEMIKAILRDTMETWERHVHDSKNPFWDANKRRDSKPESELYHKDVTRANKIMLPMNSPEEIYENHPMTDRVYISKADRRVSINILRVVKKPGGALLAVYESNGPKGTMMGYSPINAGFIDSHYLEDHETTARKLGRKRYNRKAKNAIKRLEAIRADCLKKGLAPLRWNPPTNPEWRQHITAPLVKYDLKDFKI